MEFDLGFNGEDGEWCFYLLGGENEKGVLFSMAQKVYENVKMNES